MTHRPFLLLLMLCAVALSCAHRYPASAGDDREAVAGMPVELGSDDRPVPAGTAIHWDFGDGTSADGHKTTHRFARAGEYRVTLTVTDSGGTRTDETLIKVARRPPAAAVPEQAVMAWAFDRLFTRLPRQLALIERLFGPERTQAFIEAAEGVLGFDPTRPEQVAAAGVDPEEGLALMQLPDDDALWVVLGVLDEEAALRASIGAITRHFPAESTEGPEGFKVLVTPGGTFHVAVRGGYLYLRVPPSSDTEGRGPNLKAITAASAEGLFADPLFAAARASTPGPDVFVFSRPELWTDPAQPPTGVLAPHITFAAMGVKFGEDTVELAALLGADAEGSRLMERLYSAPLHQEIAGQAPAGAAAYLSATLNPPLFLGMLRSEGGMGEALNVLDDEMSELSGLDSATLADLLSGSGSAALYFDVAKLFQDLAARQAPTPRLSFVAAAGLANPEHAATALAGLAQRLSTPLTKEDSGTALLLPGENGPLGIELRGATALFGRGQPFSDALDPNPGIRRMQGRLKLSVAPELLQGPHLLLFVDVASVIDAIRSPPAVPDVDPASMTFLHAMAVQMLEDPGSPLRPLLPIREALVHLSLAPEGMRMRGELRLRK